MQFAKQANFTHYRFINLYKKIYNSVEMISVTYNL